MSERKTRSRKKPIFDKSRFEISGVGERLVSNFLSFNSYSILPDELESSSIIKKGPGGKYRA